MPKMTNGCNEKRLKMMPHKPVPKTISIVPQFWPVRWKRSEAKVMPGNKFVKKTYTALARTS